MCHAVKSNWWPILTIVVCMWNFKSTGSAWDNALVKQMSSKTMPQIGKVTVSIIEEEQSRWLAFKSGQLDFDKLTSNAVPQALDGTKLKAEYQNWAFYIIPIKTLRSPIPYSICKT